MESDNDDEIFEQMTEGLEIDEPETIDYGKLSNTSLLTQFADVKRELRNRRERINPTTNRGKDLGAIYYGLIMELRKRRLM